MLQQTQVDTVVPYYERFMARFADVAGLAGAELQTVLKLWEGLGYYARARNLHRAAEIVCRRHGGRVPDTRREIRALPGVGPYIAAAVLSIACDRPLAVVDGNVKRILARIFTLDAPVNVSPPAAVFQEKADALLDRRRPGTFNQAMMELGAVVCRLPEPDCAGCPVSTHCRSHPGQVDKFPVRARRPVTPQVRVVIGVVTRGSRLLITRRREEGLLGGLWEFPGGKVKPGEPLESACRREIREEVGLAVLVEKHLARVRHAYTHFKIVADVFLCRSSSGRVRLDGPVDHRWIAADEMADYPFPKANHKFMDLIRREMESRL
jgi:A/G-specific adenine glycosylase